ncbi:hypothetical protein FEM48_Zijuj06G0134700 [Ziziphus jujuba var. spinosa]|uniref:Uncharacterized protein n=1 Tax=Ziziphus jujuba var. spinosa TaxID=714518 RepID=A0A978V9J6_ZIZJJ|nr:hypothetical protein FEM48_Zijuj06G0134700 [Ziziphus jujuba var. spinosa]
MVMAVLNPQDCLQNPLPSQTTTFPPKKSIRNSNGSSRIQTQQRNKSKRSTSRPKNSSPPKVEKPAAPTAAAAADLVMGQVKILKRGEEFTVATAINRPPSPKKVVNKDEKRGAPVKGSGKKPDSGNWDSKFYAGSFVSIASPPPSSLPIPGFFAKKKSGVGLSNEEATNDLLKILRLDLV